MVLGAVQMVLLDPARSYRQNFQKKKTKNSYQATHRVLLPDVRSHMGYLIQKPLEQSRGISFVSKETARKLNEMER